MEKPFKQKENIDDEACTFILSVGSLNFSDTHTHTQLQREDKRTLTKGGEGTAC